MDRHSIYKIKSFKHNGRIHRIWLENWIVPRQRLHPDHSAEDMVVLVNNQTRIREADGKEWTSRVPGVSFFIPKQWYNIVALLEESGVRYYCNIASPLFMHGDQITYIDYDLDVIVFPNGDIQVVDQDEYEANQINYHYSATVMDKVQAGLTALLARIRERRSPFRGDAVNLYYELWKNRTV